MNTSTIYSPKQHRDHSRIDRYEGDDIYSWALFVNGRPVFTGMSRQEATWRRDRYRSEGVL